jgi:SAM-dependent methyltransferase
MTEKYTCKLSDNKSFEVKLKGNVFHPTGTSDEIIKAARTNIDVPGKILDLGCGSGVVGFALHLLGKCQGPLFCSDLSSDAVELIEENAGELDIPVISRAGSVFYPWKKETFDYIIDDISGIAEDVANISPWFRKTSCESGKDGSNLVIEAINSAPLHLNDGGKFFFPVLSLSNSEKIISAANDKFLSVRRLRHKQWKLPDELSEHMDFLVELRSKGWINFEEKYGWLLWSTDIYLAEDPK